LPTYEYQCRDCESSFDVIKRISQLDETESCVNCASQSTYRTIPRTHFYGASDWDTASYNPGLGMWVKSRKHAEREAKNRGLIEVGNESPVKMLEAQDRDTAKISDEAFDKSWAKTEHFLKKELGKS
jgi:putative FmdB family regulatory protein